MYRAVLVLAVVSCLLQGCLSQERRSVSFAKRAYEYEIAESEWPEYGVPGDVNVFPTYDERSLGVWTNVARIGFKWYRDTYLKPVVKDGTYSKVFDGSDPNNPFDSTYPGFWNFNLNRAARAHCTDVATNATYYAAGGGHNDGNGTSFSTRLSRFLHWYSCAENYINRAPSSGLFRGFSSIAAFMCDGFHGLGSELATLSSCATDSGAGHRRNIMRNCKQFGCGIDWVGSNYIVTQDCTNDAVKKYSGLHIAAASHVGDITNTSRFQYMATVLTEGITVSSVKVIEVTSDEIIAINMDRLYQGKYGAVYASPSYDKLEQCRAYYFVLNNNSHEERYPAKGYFHTYGMSCDKDWENISDMDLPVDVDIDMKEGFNTTRAAVFAAVRAFCAARNITVNDGDIEVDMINEEEVQRITIHASDVRAGLQIQEAINKCISGSGGGAECKGEFLDNIKVVSVIPLSLTPSAASMLNVMLICVIISMISAFIAL